MASKVFIPMVFLVVFFNSCATGRYGTTYFHISDPDGENNTLVYGYRDIDALRSNIYGGYVYILPIEDDWRMFQRGYKSYMHSGNLFIYTNLPPGEYYIAGIIAGALTYGGKTEQIMISMEKPEPGDGIIVRPGSLVYAGSYKLIHGLDGRYFEDSEISYEEVVDDLKQILKDTPWEDIVNSEL